jgi:hypothetical protein
VQIKKEISVWQENENPDELFAQRDLAFMTLVNKLVVAIFFSAKTGIDQNTLSATTISSGCKQQPTE